MDDIKDQALALIYTGTRLLILINFGNKLLCYRNIFLLFLPICIEFVDEDQPRQMIVLLFVEAWLAPSVPVCGIAPGSLLVTSRSSPVALVCLWPFLRPPPCASLRVICLWH